MLYNEFAFFKRTNTFDGVKGINARSAHLFPDTVQLSGDEELACLCFSPKRHGRKAKKEWEEEFFFTSCKEKCLCLICGTTVTLSKRHNVERHLRTRHENVLSYRCELHSRQRIEDRKSLWVKGGFRQTTEFFFTMPVEKKNLRTQPKLRLERHNFW